MVPLTRVSSPLHQYTLQTRLTARQDNGGKIVLLEKHADVLIADHARKDCPAGSVSWKYIEESVARGELLDIGDYRIHAANIPRAVGSTRPTKGTRVPFTELDERILVTWVRRAGADALGNRIYQELAEMVSTLYKETLLLHMSLTHTSTRIILGSHGGING